LTLKSARVITPWQHEATMDIEIPRGDGDPDTSGPADTLDGLRNRMRRAASSALRAGPVGIAMLRRSMAVYAGEASSQHVPRQRVLETAMNTVVEALASRVAVKQMAVLVDAAVTGTIEGYDRYERLVDSGNGAPFSDAPLRS
jgi:hypothetical protein